MQVFINSSQYPADFLSSHLFNFRMRLVINTIYLIKYIQLFYEQKIIGF